MVIAKKVCAEFRTTGSTLLKSFGDFLVGGASGGVIG